MKQEDPVEHQIRQEAERGHGQKGARLVEAQTQCEQLRQQIEKRHADDRSGAEAEDQMQLVAQSERQHAARNGALERSEGDDDQ